MTPGGCDGATYTAGWKNQRDDSYFKYSCQSCNTAAKKKTDQHLNWEPLTRLMTEEDIRLVFDMKDRNASLDEVVAALGCKVTQKKCTRALGSCNNVATKKGYGQVPVCSDATCENQCEWAEMVDGELTRCRAEKTGGKKNYCGGSQGAYCNSLFKGGGKKKFIDALAARKKAMKEEEEEPTKKKTATEKETTTNKKKTAKKEAVKAKKK